MVRKRKVEVFSAGCTVCDDAVALVQRLACDSCEVVVLDMKERRVADRAQQLGIRSVPAVVVDGLLAACCQGVGPTESELRAAGIGDPLA